mmetsp:Transcript_10815/g.16191  ORF Transcript_10815/g.16191 Transcript_10815/m.16191 type:complete len:480 (-) Transcript_10815:142-1581(-)
MPKTSMQWKSPNGEEYTFNFDLRKHDEASSVTIAQGTIHSCSVSSSIPAVKVDEANDSTRANDEDSGTSSSSSSSSGTRKKTKTEVGYLSGYIIKRNNKNFHHDGDIVCQELHEFTVSLYDSSGRTCRVKNSNSEFEKIKAASGAMFLLEKIEINHSLKGMDMGIHFIHEFLNHVKADVGVCVMDPSTLSQHILRYSPKWNENFIGKNEQDTYDTERKNIVNLRRQFYRMGFRVVKEGPQYCDKWFLSLDKYKSMSMSMSMSGNQNPKASWLSKEEVKNIDTIPMKARKHINTGNDEMLKEVLQGLFEEEPSFGASASATATASSQQVSPLVLTMQNGIGMAMSGSKLTKEKKDHIKRLIQDGASLEGINAIHMAAANYKQSDLFDFLIGECHMSLNNNNDRDETGNLPLHVAAICSNAEAVKVLLARGARKKAKNEDGLTPLQVMEKHHQSIGDFMQMMVMGGSLAGSASDQIKNLLR